MVSSVIFPEGTMTQTARRLLDGRFAQVKGHHAVPAIDYKRWARFAPMFPQPIIARSIKISFGIAMSLRGGRRPTKQSPV
jgi:hypothetical protein